MQEIWSHGCSWDGSLEPCCLEVWRGWKTELDTVKLVRVPRWLEETLGDGTHVELHAFCDASLRAYGAAIYLKVVGSDGKPRTQLIMSQSKVAPAKTKSGVDTVPRLELRAAVVNSRQRNFVKNSLNLKVDDTHLWTDSMIVLHWLSKSASNLKTFVKNRVSEIQSTWPGKYWHHCPGESNPSDILTRGTSASKRLVVERSRLASSVS